MRTVSFSDNQVRKILNEEFVCCFTNTTGEDSVGSSISHDPSDEPGTCGKTAGRQNVQTFFMTPKSEIFHVAAGFHSPEDLLRELKFADGLYSGLNKTKTSRKKFVAAQHVRRLKSLGFTQREIYGDDSSISRTAERFSGEDLGMEMPRFNFGGLVPGNKILDQFSDVHKARTFKDHQYLVANPLITRANFERTPQELTGYGKSFFASNSHMSKSLGKNNEAMKAVNGQLNEMMKNLGGGFQFGSSFNRFGSPNRIRN